MNRLVIGASMFTIALALAVALASGAGESEADRVDRIASELRCPVCQGLAVSDSPSETARAMRDLVALRVHEGRTDEQIRDEFRASYGDWVVLDPPLAGWTGLVWLAPVALVAGGAALAWRYARRAPGQSEAAPDPAAVAALRERVRREEAADE